MDDAQVLAAAKAMCEARVLAAAKAIHEETCKRLTPTLPWEKLQNPEQSCYMAYARAALEAK